MYKIGDIVEGTVTGVQNYGVFVQLNDGQQGLIHISECTHGFIANLHDILKIGQPVKAIIIDLDEYTKKISLSIRALEKVPLSKPVVRKKRRRSGYTNQLGFETLKQQLPIWIAQAHQLLAKEKENK